MSNLTGLIDEPIVFLWLSEGRLPLIFKAIEQNQKIIYTTNSAGQTLLIAAAAAGADQLVRHLIQRGAILWKRDEVGWDAWLWAASLGNIRVLNVLRHHKKAHSMSMDHKNNTALLLLLKSKMLDQSRTLDAIKIIAAAEPQSIGHANIQGETALMRASIISPAMVNALISAGADVNQPSPVTGWCPIHLAVHYEMHTVIRALLSAGANIHLRTKEGYSAEDLLQEGTSLDGNHQIAQLKTSSTKAASQQTDLFGEIFP